MLLAKRSGYDVSADIKNDATLSNIPVVLMWSGFMDIDEAKAQHSKADRRLEKPFDADTLRGIVKDLIPMTLGNEISSFLTFPHLPDFIESAKTPSAPPLSKASFQPPPPSPSEEISNVGFNTDLDADEPESFVQAPLPNLNQKKINVSNQTEPWSSGNLERFKINIPKEDMVLAESNMLDLMDSPIVLAGQGEVQLSELEENKKAPAKKVQPSSSIASATAGIAPNLIDPAMVEHVIREQVKLVLQDIAWKIIPDVAERVLKEEIAKLLKDAEKLS